MAEFTETTVKTVNCPDCESAKVVKVGVRNGQQRYLCRGCEKKFRADGKPEGRQMEAEQIGAAIRDFYGGLSYKKITEAMEKRYDIPEPSKGTVYLWVRDYTKAAVTEMEKHPAKVGGGHWVADEMMVDVGGEDYWNFNVMDSETRYILASHLSKERTGAEARKVMAKALKAADGPPKTITTDKLRSYLRPIRELMPETRHMQSEGLTADLNNNLSERLQGTFRDRTKTLRGLDSKESGQVYLDGWTLQYNLFRDHESLHGDIPGKRAKVDAPFTEWADVVRKGTGRKPRSRKKETVGAGATMPAPSKSDGKHKELGLSGRAPKRSKPKRPTLKQPAPAYPPTSKRKSRVKPLWERQRPRLPAKR